jgi:hypothetical protein
LSFFIYLVLDEIPSNFITVSNRQGGRGISQAVVTGISPRSPGYVPASFYVVFAVDIVTLEQVFSEFFGFPC